MCCVGAKQATRGSCTVAQASVLIISDEPEFAPTIMARWQSERNLPSFFVMATPAWSESLVAACDLVIMAGIREVVPTLFKAVDDSGKPALLLASNGLTLQQVRSDCPHFMLVREHEGWVDAVVALASESLRRLDANARARRAEQALTQAEGHAMLGRYMLEMRHGLNNALTSVLGNSELLLLEPGAFSAGVRDQLATIHTMALRIHDVVQRFSSMESEIKLAARSHSEMKPPSTSLAAVR